MREVRVEQTLAAEVKKAGGLCRKWVCPGYRGAPDRIVIWPGAIFFVETKTPKGRLSAHQKFFHRVLASYGFDVVVLNTQQKVRDWVDAQAGAVLKAGACAGLISSLSARHTKGFLPEDIGA